MQKYNHSQLEMFQTSEYSINTEYNPKEKPRVKEEIRGYQTKIYIVLALIALSVTSYSLGVERGKKTILSSKHKPQILPLQPESKNTSLNENLKQPRDNRNNPLENIQLTESPKIASIKELKPQPLIIKDKDKTETGSFTVQVASISKTANIIKEVSRLKAKGYNAFSLAKGKYNVICIGKYDMKEDAQNKLEKLKTEYPDSILRRL